MIPGGVGTLLFSTVSGIVLKKVAKWGLLCWGRILTLVFSSLLPNLPQLGRGGGGIKTWKVWEEFGPKKKIKKTPDFIALKKFLEHE